MNYIELINHFWKLNKELNFSPPETQLYFKLLDTCNSLGWKNPFFHSNGYIIGEICISEKTLVSARNYLKTAGLIDYKSGKKKREITEYTLFCSFENSKCSSINGTLKEGVKGTQKEGERGSQKGENAPDNNKKNQNKKNQTNSETEVSVSSRDDELKKIKLLFDSYNEICLNLPKAIILSKRRKDYIGARMAEHGYDACLKMLQTASKSDYLAGQGANGWMANLEWLFRPNNFVKVLENNYKNRPTQMSLDTYGLKPSPMELIEEAYNNITSDGNS